VFGRWTRRRCRRSTPGGARRQDTKEGCLPQVARFIKVMHGSRPARRGRPRATGSRAVRLVGTVSAVLILAVLLHGVSLFHQRAQPAGH
jgi:hypothetical protein